LIIWLLTKTYFLNTIAIQMGICTQIQITIIRAGIYETVQTKRRKYKEINNVFKQAKWRT
jgi:hypothetical protein